MSGAAERPEVSLCLVVRDEAELLPRFLEAARGLWDELVAVDTGSRDGTPALLEAAGARVLRRPWTGDFSAARNAGLDAARGRWILYLDPDELVSPELVASVRAIAADPRAGAAVLTFRNHLPHGHVREAALLRLFRAGPGLRFRHAIHEDVCWAVEPMLAATGLALVRAAGWVDHLGYVRDRAAARGKRERDAALLRETLARDPLDLYGHLKLLEQARFWDDRALWQRAAAEARAALARAGERAADLPEDQRGELLVLLADAPPARSPADVLAALDAAPQPPRSAAFHLRRGELLERLGRPAEACEAFRSAQAFAGRTAHRQLATVRPLLGLARLAVARGDLGAAAPLVTRALADAPRDPEALLLAVVLARFTGGEPAALAFAEAHRAGFGDSAELAEALREGARLTAP